MAVLLPSFDSETCDPLSTWILNMQLTPKRVLGMKQLFVNGNGTTISSMGWPAGPSTAVARKIGVSSKV